LAKVFLRAKPVSIWQLAARVWWKLFLHGHGVGMKSVCRVGCPQRQVHTIRASERPCVLTGGFRECGGGAAHPLGVLQKNSGSTNFENSEDSRQHDYYYYQFLPRILRVGGREGMKGLGALQRNQLPHPPCKNPGSATVCAAEVVNEQRTGAYHRGKYARHYRAECERPLITRRLAMIN